VAYLSILKSARGREKRKHFEFFEGSCGEKKAVAPRPRERRRNQNKEKVGSSR